jgi:hypothetical protein
MTNFGGVFLLFVGQLNTSTWVWASCHLPSFTTSKTDNVLSVPTHFQCRYQIRSFIATKPPPARLRRMNKTLPASGPTAPAGSGNNFSRSSMISMFLALQLCQLTQPYGSLLFRGGRGSFCRCNPISSFAEACVIYFYLSS